MRSLGFIALVAITCVGSWQRVDGDERVASLRRDILAALVQDQHHSKEAAAAYLSLFQHVGLKGLPALAADDDPSIALQAAWELARIPVKKTQPAPLRTPWGFEKKSIDAFCAGAAKRLKADLPEWWKAELANGDVFPRSHHAFLDPKALAAATNVKLEGREVVFTHDKHVLSLPKAVFNATVEIELAVGTAPTMLWERDLWVVALPVYRGYPFTIVASQPDAKTHLWSAAVWAARRGSSEGEARSISPVEIRRHGSSVLVYGCEQSGMYIESFDAKTGKCQLRFCTGYWMHHSESWGIK